VRSLRHAHLARKHLAKTLQCGRIHWTIHRAFCAYQSACEQRRQLAVEVGELAQQLTDALTAAGWSITDARTADVHQLARQEPH